MPKTCGTNLSGRLRHRVTFQSQSDTQDEYGQPSPDSPSDEFRAQADIVPLSGRERTEAQMVNADVTHEITIRYRDGVTPKHRIKYGSRIFNIQSVIDPDESKRELRIQAVEDVDGG